MHVFCDWDSCTGEMTCVDLLETGKEEASWLRVGGDRKGWRRS